MNQITPDIEIIVNNDSNDITEIKHPQVTYHYNKFDNISAIYKFLLEQATGDYVYYLEDDDYLVKGFADIELDADLIAGNYMPTYETPNLINFLTQFKKTNTSPEYFVKMLNFDMLQLSQFIYKRYTIIDFDFPTDNNVHNDINLTLHSAKNSKDIKTLSNIFFYQTKDGKDNISFPDTNPSLNSMKHLDFLENYEIFKTATRTTGP
jgi:hypothetical protein